MSNRQETYIYESPDGGDTVYRRHFGDTQRELHSISDKKRSQIDNLRKDKLWGDIRRAAETNLSLQEALERVKLTYYLTEDYEKRYGNSKT